MEKLDIAIIGGGVAGLYAGQQILNHANLNQKKFAIFESSNRLGGRIETVSLHGFLAEAGSMRIEPDVQVMLNQLISDLQLTTVETHENYGISHVPDNATLFPLRENEKNKTPLELIYLAISHILNMDCADLSSLTCNDFHHIYRKGAYKGKYLWEMGWWEVLSDILSYGAIQYINYHGHFYHFIQENLNAAAETVFFIRLLKTNHRLKNIKGGMYKIIEALEKVLYEASIPIYKQHKLIAIQQQDDFVELTFDHNQVIYAKHVLLTMPAPNLSALSQYFPSPIQTCLHATQAMHLLKCMFVVKKPWWGKIEANYQAHKIPTRELHYYQSPEGTGMVMVYADRPFSNFWRALFEECEQDASRINMDEKLISGFCQHMPCEKEDILAYCVRDWGKPPYNGAVSFWKRGYHLFETMQTAKSFNLHSDNHQPDNIFICSDTFSDYQGFIEGSLRATNETIQMLASECELH